MRRKVLLVAILIIAMLLQCMMPLSVVFAETGEEQISDGNVRIYLNLDVYNAVKSELRAQGIIAEYRDANYSITISQAQLEKVKKLNLSNADITDLDNYSEDLLGLEAFTNLEELNLHANYLTVESNLQILDSFENLRKVDLSSNAIASVRSIANFHSGKTVYDITDQRITSRNVIVVDDSSEATTRQTKALLALPDILLENDTGFDPAWLYDRNGFLTREIVSYTDPETGVTTSPEIDYANSFREITADTDISQFIDYTDGAEMPYPGVVLTVAAGDGSTYRTLKGLVKFKIIVNDSTSKLANTQMTFYYAVVDEEETGITFDDGNCYKAVKANLTQGQELNQNRVVKTETDERNIYSRAYDEALIMVIDTDDVINKIPELVLNDKRIKDLKGIEEFVGLEENLNVSYNYITTLRRILELEENKKGKETELQARYAKVLGDLSTIRSTIKSLKDQREAKVKAIAEKESAIARETDANKIAALNGELETLYADLAKIETDITNYETLQSAALAKLYDIYAREYLLTTILPYDVDILSRDDLNYSTLDNIKNWANQVISKVTSLENTKSLTGFELDLIVNVFGIPTEQEVQEIGPDKQPTGNMITVPIENPIAKYFQTYTQQIELSTEDKYAQYYGIVSNFKYLDVIIRGYNYCLIARMNDADLTDCVFEEGLERLRVWFESNDFDTSFIDYIMTAGNSFESYIPTCNGAYDRDTDLEYNLSGKLVSAAGEISNYIILPAIQKLNIADNKVRTLKGIDALVKLKELNAWKNLVNDITNVDWTAFEKIKVLNVGYNQISNITPLEVLIDLESLDVSYNLLSGRFTFKLINMPKLMYANFSHNQYNDIGYANDQYILKALGYDQNGDGIADGLTVPEYLQVSGMQLSFQYQTLEMSTTIVRTGREFVEFELPLIFRQFEMMDNERTSFGVDSFGGLVEPEGRTVKLKVPAVGEYDTIVDVRGRNGYDHGESLEGIGYGTILKIHYTVVGSEEDIPVNPDNPSNPDTPITPGGDEDDLSNLVFGYSVSNGYIFVYTPDTSLTDFRSQLIDAAKYNVSIEQNKSANNIGTGSVATISDKSTNKVLGSLEVVVKGDLNGDGEADALDSGIIRGVINDTAALVGVYASSADVNNDNDIDSLDSLLLLQYRADRIDHFGE